MNNVNEYREFVGPRIKELKLTSTLAKKLVNKYYDKIDYESEFIKNNKNHEKIRKKFDHEWCVICGGDSPYWNDQLSYLENDKIIKIAKNKYGLIFLNRELLIYFVITEDDIYAIEFSRNNFSNFISNLPSLQLGHLEKVDIEIISCLMIDGHSIEKYKELLKQEEYLIKLNALREAFKMNEKYFYIFDWNSQVFKAMEKWSDERFVLIYELIKNHYPLTILRIFIELEESKIQSIYKEFKIFPNSFVINNFIIRIDNK